MIDKRAYIDHLKKHLPPSTSILRLADVGGNVGADLAALRDDLDVQTVMGDWSYTPNSLDAIVAYHCQLDTRLLTNVLHGLRPGGRLIIVNPEGQVDEQHVSKLENAGYTRILVESVFDGQGVLIRGEKPHTTADTLARIQQVAQGDDDGLTLDNFRGRYVHLLIQQTPNKPVWKLAPDEKIVWHAAALQAESPILLAFSSLPKAVGFMQPAVVQGLIRDVNKVGKFTRDTAQAWELPILLNPKLDALNGQTVTYLPIDPDTAEAPDE